MKPLSRTTDRGGSLNGLKSQFLSILLLSTVFTALHTRAAGAEKPYNVLLIMCDDLAACLGCNGNTVCQTPNLDQLAKDGICFTRAHANYARCSQSRASMMFGKYPLAGSATSVRNFRKENPDIQSVSELFRNNGYYTARIGKIYHMGIPGDIVEGHPGVNDEASWVQQFYFKAPEDEAKGEKLDFTKEQKGIQGGRTFTGLKAAKDARLHDTLAINKAVDLLKENQDKPFFIGVGLVRPHVPLVAPAEFFDTYPQKDMVLPKLPDGDLEDLCTAHKGLTNIRSWGMTEEQQKGVVSAYYACVNYVDTEVGRLLKHLEELGLADTTIVIFTSDHGYHLGEHDMWQKRSLLEQTTHVPLLIRAPGDAFDSGNCDHQVELVDLYPTLTEICGLEAPHKLDGRSLKPLLEKPAETAWVERPSLCVMDTGRTIKYNGWRYVRWPSVKDKKGALRKLKMTGGKPAVVEGETVLVEEELYDLTNDPGEFHSLADNPEYSQQLQKMRDTLKQIEQKE